MPTRPVFRFAPSPNGELHLGHALSALVGWEAAREVGGRFLLRIEDIDTGRTRPEYVSGIFADLRWLGLAWEEPVLFQSTRFAAYADAAQRLQAMGLLYACFATRAEIEAAAISGAVDPDGAPLYPGLWKGRSAAEIDRRKTASEPYALRIDIDKALAVARTALGGPAADVCRNRRGRRTGDRRRRTGAVGRCRHRAQGYAGQLSSGGGGGRCLAGRHSRHARA